MTGICSAHQGHDPACFRCTWTPAPQPGNTLPADAHCANCGVLVTAGHQKCPKCDCYDSPSCRHPGPEPAVTAVMAALAAHRWKSMGVASVECECGAILYGDDNLTQFPADEAFRRHLATAALEAAAPALYAKGAAAALAKVAAVISPEQFRKLADWFDADDEFKEAMFPETWSPRSRQDEVQRDLRAVADLLDGGTDGH